MKLDAKVLFKQIVTEDKFALIHLSLEEAAGFVRRRALWPRSFVIFIVWMNWRTLQSTSFLSWCVSYVLRLVYRLVSHILGTVHWKWEIITTEQVQFFTKKLKKSSIVYWGKGSIVG